MKETAVEWFEEQQAQLFNQLEIGEIGISEYKYYLDLTLDQAKEMEREQIAKAYDCTNSMAMNGEQYYNKTFKSE